MRKVYISSTLKDLADFRTAVAEALRKIRYDVIRMEEYVARDQRTRAACEADVAACDVYVGIFAWRYGYVPKDDNEAGRSITELEYRKASGDKTCLVFLLSDEAPWPSTQRDAEAGEGDRGERIRNLRTELKERCAGYFSTPHQLAVEVIAAIYQDESTKRVHQLSVIDEIKQGIELGPSYLPNIRDKIVGARDTEVVEISLGPTPWWTTRLHLVSALASDYTRIRQFVFLDADGQYISMASPIEVRRALTRRYPQLERAYLESRPAVFKVGGASADEIDQIMMLYPEKLFNAVGSRPEKEVKEEISADMLRRDLGIESSADAVEQIEKRPSLQRWEILRRTTPFVAVLDRGRLVSVIDRAKMASEIAAQAVGESFA